MPTASARLPSGTLLAETSTYETVEGNVYFPADSIKDSSILQESSLTTNCPWKGTAHYYSLNVDGQVIKDAAWYYPNAKEKAKNIEGAIAFYKNKVKVTVE